MFIWSFEKLQIPRLHPALLNQNLLFNILELPGICMHTSVTEAQGEDSKIMSAFFEDWIIRGWG